MGICKVLVVDDSPTAREMISTILNTDPEIQIIGKVANGREAINFLENQTIKPDILTTDINMPVLNGFDMIEYIMAYQPLPILIVTALDKDANFMRALNLGALDIIEKPGPKAWQQLPKVGIELIEKVKLLSRVKVITHLAGRHHDFNKNPRVLNEESKKIICIASSTGGPNTLLKLLKFLPGNFPAPIVIVQHMSESFFIKGMVEWFRTSLNLKVEKVEDGLELSSRTVYIAPIRYHLVVRNYKLYLEDGPMVNNQKPAADLLFKSAAECYGSNTVGIVLTGIGEDGADGIVRISKAGGITMAQNEESCVVFGMPKAAIGTNCVEKVLDVEGIAKELMRLV